MAAAALKPAEYDHDDQDVLDLLVHGLLELTSAKRVRRLRMQVTEQVVHHRSGPTGAGGQIQALSEDAIRQALAVIDPIISRADGGEVVALMAPLYSRTGVDVFVLESDRSGSGFSSFECTTVATLRDQAAAALAVRHAEAEARHDPLTGCLNHGAMHAQLQKEVARAERSSSRLACVMLDLDNFKAVNERYGHPVGDRLLRAVAAAMLEESRGYDHCCRYGGDEFLVILPDAEIADAVRTAGRLLAAVNQSVTEHANERISVVATAGVAGWRPGEAAAELVRRADQALIERKATGKDGIGVA